MEPLLHLRSVIAVAAAVMGARQNERVHGARHAYHVTETPAASSSSSGLLSVRECGNSPSSIPARKTTGNSRGLWRSAESST